MPYFKTEQEVYDTFGTLFDALMSDEELGPQLRRANTIVQYRYEHPDSIITVNMLEGGELRVDRGKTDLTPEVVMTMEADASHRFWLGDLNIATALARGQMTAKGPVMKLLKLIPLAKPVFPRYRRLLEESGRGDLVEAA